MTTIMTMVLPTVPMMETDPLNTDNTRFRVVGGSRQVSLFPAGGKAVKFPFEANAEGQRKKCSKKHQSTNNAMDATKETRVSTKSFF